MADEKTLYELLGVPESADAAALRDAYRRLAKQCHPDVCRCDDAEERFKAVHRAYKALSEPRERGLYDSYLRWRRRKYVGVGPAWRRQEDAPRSTWPGVGAKLVGALIALAVGLGIASPGSMPDPQPERANYSHPIWSHGPGPPAWTETDHYQPGAPRTGQGGWGTPGDRTAGESPGRVSPYSPGSGYGSVQPASPPMPRATRGW